MTGYLGWILIWLSLAQIEAPMELQIDGAEIRMAAAPKSKANSTTDQPVIAAQFIAPNETPGANTNQNTGSKPAAPEAVTTDAERIARLQRSVVTDEARLRELKRSLLDPDSEFSRAEKTFKELDGALDQTKRKLQEAQNAGRAEVAANLEQSLTQQLEPWNAAKVAFELALEERRTRQASITTLESKIQRDREAAEKLLAPVAPTAAPVAAPASPAATDSSITPLTAPAAPNIAGSTPASEAPATPAAGSAVALPPAQPALEAAPVPAALPATPLTASPMQNAMMPGLPDAVSSSNAKSAQQVRADTELLAATAKAEQLVAAADVAEKEAGSVTERLDLLKEDIAQQRKLRAMAIKKLDAAVEQTERLTKSLEDNPQGGEKWDEIWSQLTQAQQTAAASRVESRNLADRLDELQSEQSTLQQEEMSKLREAAKIRSEAEAAKMAVDELSNPFSVRNITIWLETKGLIALMALLTMISVMRMGKYVEPRLKQIIISTSPRGTREERENRASTLVGVLLNVVRIVVVIVCVITILEQFSVPVGPLLGGAAVVGLAVAFGAQSLIKDYFTGFMVLLEQQYMINDVVQIGDIKGQVERITMRMTVLRDLEGKVHFIPHGQITTVTNMTHGWSRALIDIGVSYNEDIDQVIGVLVQLGQELRNDPKYGEMILDNPEMLGVESLGDSSVIVRMMVKTRPLRQWELKREWLKRVKRRFDELGIEIPFPHQTLYLRTTGDESLLPLYGQNDRVSRAS